MTEAEQKAVETFSKEGHRLIWLKEELGLLYAEYVFSGATEQQLDAASQFIEFAQKEVDDGLSSKRSFVKGSEIRKQGGLSYADAMKMEKPA